MMIFFADKKRELLAKIEILELATRQEDELKDDLRLQLKEALSDPSYFEYTRSQGNLRRFIMRFVDHISVGESSVSIRTVFDSPSTP